MTPKFKPGDMAHHVSQTRFADPYKILAAGVLEYEGEIKEVTYLVSFVATSNQPQRIFITESELKPVEP